MTFFADCIYMICIYDMHLCYNCFQLLTKTFCIEYIGNNTHKSGTKTKCKLPEHIYNASLRDEKRGKALQLYSVVRRPKRGQKVFKQIYEYNNDKRNITNITNMINIINIISIIIIINIININSTDYYIPQSQLYFRDKLKVFALIKILFL